MSKFTVGEYTELEKEKTGNQMYGGKKHDAICDYIQEEYSLTEAQINDVSMGIWLAIEAEKDEQELLLSKRIEALLQREGIRTYNALCDSKNRGEVNQDIDWLRKGYMLALKDLKEKYEN